MIKVCYVHDVVHDFCSEKAKKQKFLKLINSGDTFHASDFLHHRLTIHTDNRKLHKKCALFNSNKCLAVSKHLISLKVSGPLDDFRYICHTRPFGLVRVLQLDFIVLKGSLIEEIGSLFHLRFLSIHALGKAIPVSWLNLQNLETLFINIHYSTMVLLPRILQLSKLKHVKINVCSFFEEKEDIQSRILESGNSSNLTTLSGVVISYSEGMSDDALEKFPILQHLDCIIMESQYPPTHDYWFPKLDVLNKLESFIARHKRNEYPSLIRQPNGYHFPTSLKELRLSGFLLRPDLLSAIAALPKLDITELNHCNFVDNKWDASEDIYLSLKTLILRDVQLSEWQVESDTFPKLEKLILKLCALCEIPCAFIDIDTLKSIDLSYVGRELGDSAIEIKKNVADFTGEDRLDVHTSHLTGNQHEETEDEDESD